MNEKTAKTLVETIFVLVLAIPMMIWGGFVLSKLWAWFVVPLGVMPIGIAHAIGIAVLMTLPHMRARQTEGISPAASIGIPIFGPLLALVVGFLAKGFM